MARLLLIALALAVVCASVLASATAPQRVLLHLGASGSNAAASETAESPSYRTTLAQLDAWRAERCTTRVFTVRTLPAFGSLFAAASPLESLDAAAAPLPLKGEQIEAHKPLANGWVYFEIADRSDIDRTATFSYTISCDDAVSDGSATVTIPALPTPTNPVLSLSSRIEYSASMLHVHDTDEDEYSAQPSFELEIEGGFAPTLRLPPPAVDVSAAISVSEDSDVTGKVASVVRGSGSASAIELLSRDVRVEVNRANPLAARIRLSVDGPDGSPAVVSDAFSFTHALEHAPSIDGVAPGLSADITVAVVDVPPSSSSVPVALAPPSRITSVAPTNGPIHGGTAVRINGEHFSSDTVYACNFGAAGAVPAAFTSETALQCTTPSVAASSRVELVVLSNGSATPEMTVPFAFSQLPVVDGVVPSMGEVGRETYLAVSGRYFENVGTLTCLFENSDSPQQQWRASAMRVDSTLVQCAAPPQLAVGHYSLQVSLNNQDYSARHVSAQLVVHAALVLESAEPSSGPSTGGSAVTVRGSNFAPSEFLSCRFGSQSARAIFVSSTQVTCMSPAWDPQTVDRTVDVRVALNGLQFSQQSVRFQYYTPPVVTRTVPAILPPSTSVSLNVSAQHLSRLRATSCRVGELVVKAEYLEPALIRCGPIRTPSTPGTLELHISLNGQDFSTSGIAIPVHAPVRLSAVEPLAVAQGSDVAVAVSGTGFIATETTKCSFGSTVVAASVVSRELVRCPLPRALPSGTFEIRVSVNGEHYSLPTSLRVTVFNVPVFTAIAPTFGLSLGGESVAVRGTGFVLPDVAPQILCAFGSARLVPAQVVNSTLLRCVTPAFAQSMGEQSAPIAFVVGYDRVSTSLRFRYAPMPVFTRALPGTITVGERNDVVVEGYRFSRAFDYRVAINSDETGSVQAQLLPNGSGIAFVIEARADLVEGVLLPLHVSQNGTAFVATGIHLKVVRPLRTSDFGSLDDSNSSVAPASCSALLSHVLIGVCLVGDGPNSADLLNDSSDLLVPAVSSTGTPSTSNAVSSAVEITNESSQREDFVCRVDAEASSWTTSNIVSCIAPPSSQKDCHAPVWMREPHAAPNASTPACEIEASLSFLTPTSGTIEGGTVVTLRGSGFKSDDSLVCFFGDTQVQVTRVNATVVSVVAPAASTNSVSTVAVRCLENGVLTTSPDLAFVYTPSVQVVQIAPQSGYASASTRVFVSGIGFQRELPVVCHFGEASTPAQFVSANEVHCTSPRHAPGVVRFAISTAAQSADRNKSTAIGFEFIADPVLQRVFPPFGSETGGSRLLLIGANSIAQRGVECMFEARASNSVVVMPAVRVADTVLACYSPPLPPGVAHVRVKLHGTASSSYVEYTTTVLPRLLSIQPQVVMEGQSTAITLAGAGFVNSSLFRCRFGDDVVTSTQLDKLGRAVCFTPLLRPGPVRVQISTNSQDFANDSVTLEVFHIPVIEYFEPSFALIGEATTIRVVGRTISQHAQLVCHFTELNVTVSAVGSNASTTRLCAAPNVTEPHGLRLNVQIREASRGAVLLTAPFQYLRSPVVTHTIPNAALETQGTLVYVVGHDLFVNSETTCQFGSNAHRVVATRVNATAITCVAPSHRPERVQLRVCVSAFQCSASSAWFEFRLFPTTKKLVPTLGYHLERTRVAVLGDGFFNASSLACRFGNAVSVPGTLRNDSAIECTAPALESGCVHLDLVIDGQLDRSARRLEFCNVPRLHVSAVVPANGPAKGGTRVFIAGGGFLPSKQYICSFGDRATAADIVSESQLFCVAPPGPLRTVLFAVREAGMTLHPAVSDLTFRYTDMPAVTAIRPSMGSEAGMYQVLINGSNFVRSSALRCRFGARDVVPAEWISDTALSCIAPKHATGVVNVDVTNNLLDFTSDAVVFEFLANPVVLSFEPLAVDASVATRLTLRGRGFRNVSSLRCIIGAAFTRAAYISPSEVRCGAWRPAQSSATVGVTDLDAAMNAAFAPTRLSVSNFAAGLSLHPTFGSVTGGTPLVITGTQLNAASSAELSCRFCASKDKITCSESMRCRFEAGALRCLSPAWTGPYRDGTIEVVHTYDANKSSVVSFPYRYHEPLGLKSIHPSVGSTRGGTLVTVIGTHFAPSETLRCVVGDTHTMRATFLSQTAVACVMPPSGGSTQFANVSVSLNGVDVERSSLQFTYIDDAAVSAISPSAGPLSEVSMVRLSGSNFVASPESSCIFGDHVLPAIVHSSKEVTCLAHASVWTTAGAVAVGFSSNGQERTNATLEFVFYDSPSAIRVTPLYGSSSGGTHLTFTFEQRSDVEYCSKETVLCAVSDIVTTGSWVAPGQIRCVTPASAQPGPARTRISLNGQHFTDGPVFWYMEPPQFTQLSPSVCYDDAYDEPVHLLGSAFPRVSELWCRFGTASPSRASWMSSGAVICRTPRHPLGTAKVAFAMNGVDFVETGLAFEFVAHNASTRNAPAKNRPDSALTDADDLQCLVPYATASSLSNSSAVSAALNWVFFATTRGVAPMQVLGMAPRHAIVGYAQEVTISVSDLQHADVLWCRVGESLDVKARMITRTLMSCVVPSFVAPDVVRLAVSTNGIDFVESQMALTLTIHALPSVRQLQQSAGSIHGGDVVIVQGRSFFDTGDSRLFFCAFGADRLAPATFMSPTEIACVVPVWTLGDGSSEHLMFEYTERVRVGFRSSNDNVILESPPLEWTYYPDYIALTVEPPIVFTGEHSVVTIAGFGHQLPRPAIECTVRDRRGAMVSRSFAHTSALRTELEIETNISAPGVHFLELQSGSFVLTTNALMLQAKSKMHVLDVVPRTGPLRGRTAVYFHVHGLSPLVESLLCVFGNVSTVATAINATSLWCRSPPSSYPGSVSLSVSLLRGPSTLFHGRFEYAPDEIVTAVRPQQMSAFANESLVVTGANFVRSASTQRGATCRIGAVVTQAIVRSATEVLCAPAQLAEGIHVVTVACDGANYAASRISVTVTARMRLITTLPSRSPSFGGAPVSVIGQGFFSIRSALRCVFGNRMFTTEGIMQSSTRVLCPVPDVNAAVMLPLSLLIDSVETNALLHRFDAPLLLASVEPSFGFPRGGMQVTVTVAHAGSGHDELWCAFGAEQSPAHWVSVNQLVCTTPALAPGRTKLSIDGTHQSVEGSELSFDVIPELFVTDSRPAFGAAAGGTRVTLTLSRSLDESMMQHAVCLFGSVLTSAELVASAVVVCAAPARPTNESSVHVTLSLNGREFVPTPSAFQYYERHTVVEVRPAIGTTRGGFQLIVVMDEAIESSAYACGFNISGVQSFAPARSKSRTELECTVVALPGPSDVRVSVWMNGERHSANSVVFRAIDLPAIQFFSPATVPASSDAVIRVVGVRFPVGVAPFCRVGESGDSIEGRLVTTSLLECDVPPMLPGNYSVAVTWNDEEFVVAADKLTVQHTLSITTTLQPDPLALNTSQRHDPPLVASIHPQNGSLDGRTKVTIRGSFQAALEYECMFDSEAVVAKVTSLSSLACLTPAVTHARVSAFSVRVTGDKRVPAFTGITFEHYNAPVVRKIAPHSASTAGGDEIVVTGENLASTGSLSCRFGDHVATQMRIVSDTVAVCVAPAHLLGFVTLEISLNGVDYTSAQHVLHYFDAVDAIAVSPQMLAASGGTKVSVKLERLSEYATYECVFIRDNTTLARPAYAMNESELMCYAPPWSVGDARVGVVVNGKTQLLSEQSVTFTAQDRALELSDFVSVEIREDSIYPQLGPRLSVANEMPQRVRLTEDDDDTVSSPLMPSPTENDPDAINMVVKGDESNDLDEHRKLVELDLCDVDPAAPRCMKSLPPMLGMSELEAARVYRGSDPDDLLSGHDIAVAVVDNRPEVAMPTLVAISPQFLTGGTLEFVQVYGSDFEGSALLACLIGDVHTSASYVSATTIRCELGNVTLLAGTHTVEVSNNGHDFTNSEVELVVVAPIAPLRVDPARGLINQRIRVAVFGAAFAPLLHLQCLIGESYLVNATFVSESWIECELPAVAAPAVMRLAVTGNGVQFVQVPTPFVYEDAVVLYKIYPTSGPDRGGTSVTLSGEGFANDRDPLYCQFGPVFVPAVVQSATTVTCLSPPRRAMTARVVNVGVTKYSHPTVVSSDELAGVNADVSAFASVTFSYRVLPSVVSIEPAIGTTAGGTRVRMSVVGVDIESATWCRFGDISVKSEVGSTEGDTIVCVAPPAAQGRVFLEVSTNKVDFSESFIPFYFERRASLTRLTPLFGSIGGGTTVTILGHDFNDTGTLECAFGSDRVPASWLSSQSLECKTPPGFSVRNAPVVAVTVYLNGQDTAQGVLQFTFVNVPRVLSVDPLLGPASGGTEVVVRGTNIVAGDDLTCVFGDVESPAKFVSSTEARCQSPPQAASTVFVRLVVGETVRPNHAMLSETVALFQYYKPIVVQPAAPASATVAAMGVAVAADVSGGASIDADTQASTAESLRDALLQPQLTPLNGFVDGGTLVYISGATFSALKSYSCAFDGTIVLSEFVNQTHVGCRAPAAPAPGYAVVKISDNGVDYSQFNLAFVYEAPLFVTRISPFGGNVEGGQLVTVTGGNFASGAERLFCRFGDRVVNATVVSSTSATCVAPPLAVAPSAPMQVALEVSSNGQDYSSSGIVFRYALTPQVTQLIPNHGPQRGETEVIVIGVNFANTSSLSCAFSERGIVQAAAFIDSTRITCVSPARRQEGDVFVEVSNYGVLQDASFTKSKVIFTYDRDLVIETVTPALGPTIGNFSVALTGGPFRRTDATRCRFAEVVVVATWVSYDEILCMAPPHVQGVFALHVTQNDQDYIDTGVPFLYYPEQAIRRIYPVFGPATVAGTTVTVNGSGFVNSSLLACRFGYVVTPGVYVNSQTMHCVTPPLPPLSGGLQSVPLSEHRNRLPDPSHGSVYLFPDAHYYPQYWSRLVSLEVSNNRQDFSLSGVTYLYHKDATIDAIYPKSAYDVPRLAVYAKGSNFINSTSLTCRMGLQTFQATFVTSQLLLCMVEDPIAYQDSSRDARIKVGRHALFEISNNGKDFTSSHQVFEFLGSCPSGFYCPQELAGKIAACPRGSFCPGQGNRNFTLCPRGTYQPQPTQSACLRCPVGYHCPHTGMHVPRLCPAGFVCDVTGIEDVEQLCPEGHFCLEGTATTSIACSPLARTSALVASTTAGEGLATLRRRPNREVFQGAIGARRSGCWNNETSDFGLQTSSHPSRFWMDLRKLPLAPNTVFAPIRGRFCLDDSCVRLADANDYQVQDESFDYSSTRFALRRPVPCPKGTYCHPGTAGNDLTMKNYSTPQPCFESMYCPEGSPSPLGYGECPIGFYCPFGTRIPCPAGTYCPRDGHAVPIACPPGTFNAMVSQANCTACPVGFICPGFNRLLPVLCPAGYVCSKRSLASPNSLCPKGFYCLEGTATSDGFRNDTRLRPYPCRPGTYCLKGVVADEIRVGDYRYAQNCTAGFYCELGSSSPKGSGLCPRGFTCPSGTAAPIPTDVGKFADLEGTVAAAECAPGYYSPTIESTTCIPCPPGTSCENDGTAVATVCGPGSYRGGLNADGVSCLACPQGTWSKNWEIRGVEECIKCAPGTVCPIDGITHPCTSDDLPHVFVPLFENLSISECLDKGEAYFFGVLLEPWIDEHGRGPHFLSSRDGKCYENFQPRGSVLYQRLADFHGSMYELTTGVPHQGYGDVDQYPAPNIFDRGSLVIDLATAQMYDVSRNCTQGFFHKGQWFPGTCEADIFCSATSVSSEEFVAQAQPCPEGFVCDLETSADKAFLHTCPGGYVCGSGTTPDLSIEAPRGQLSQLCPATKYCQEGTAESQKDQSTCPAGYFCPTGTMNPYLGYVANDAMRRRLSSTDANPFLYMDNTKYISDGDIRIVSAHDKRCFDGIDDDLRAIFHRVQRADGKTVVINRAVERDIKCARDHKWRHVELAIRRNDCNCVAQVKVVQRVYQLWKCTVTPSIASPTIYDPNMYGWAAAYVATSQCRFASTDAPGGFLNLTQQIISDAGLTFQLSWTESAKVASYAALRAIVVAKYDEHVSGIPSVRTAVDPYLYDLFHAINIVERFGEETPAMVGLESGTTANVLRLDTCACRNMLKCPNGTTSALGSDDIYDCVKTGSEILQRLTPIPLSHPRLVNGSDFKALSGMNKGIGSIMLQPLEVATVTINTTQISTNITYKDHYQISVYTNCKPCPPRYQCDLMSTPPACLYPDNESRTAAALYASCMAEKGDTGMCDAMPYFCEKRNIASTNAAGEKVTTVIPGCCSCERREMPQYFEDTTQDLGFPDNKHGYLQFSISALERTELTIVLELLHGLYVQDFVDGFTDDRFDLDIFTPSRADYTPATPSTNNFFAVLHKPVYDSLMLPLNLPESRQRVVGTLSYEYAMEERIFIDRISDIMVGDPSLPTKHAFIRNKQQNTFGMLLASTEDSSSSGTVGNSSTARWPVVAPTEYFGLYPTVDARSTVVYSDTWWTQKLDGMEYIALPYFPFFSSCRGFDSHMWIPKLLEAHPDCTFVPYDETIEVNQYPWKKKTVPNADKCTIEYNAESTTSSGGTAFDPRQRGINLPCTYEENLEGGAEKPRWYEAATGTTLFYLTKDPASADDFVGQEVSETHWGRTELFKSYLGTDDLIAVQVGASNGLQLAVPQEVYFNLTYYQMTPGTKRLVGAEVNFGRLCTVSRSSDILAKMAKKGIVPCAISKATGKLASSEYTLQVSWEALDWFELMNLFQFTVDVYLVFFTLVGLLSIVQGLIIWLINRLFTKMKKPPKFHMKILLQNVAYPPCIGILLAVIPILVVCAFIYTWWYGFSSDAPLTDPSAVTFEGVAGDWLDQISLSQDRVTKYKKGRVGVSLVVAGIYLLLLGARLLVPETLDPQYEDNAYKEMAAVPDDAFAVEDESEKAEANEFWEPRRWKQANLMLLTLSFMGVLLVIWEFSYSPMFTSNIYAFLVAFKVLRNVVEILIENLIFEKLLVMPFVVVLSLSESTIAMGSADFLGFTLFYFVNLSFLVMERLYFAPLLRHLWSMWPKWKLMLHRKLQKKRRRTREQKAQDEAEWRRVCEKIDNQAAGVEVVLEGVTGYCVVFTELFLTPLLLAFQVWFSEDTKMPELYGVKQTDLLYYALFSLFIIPSNLVMGVFQLNTLELAHGWKLYEYISYQKHRFATRDHRWQMRDGAKDESIHPAFQSLDLLCVSSQFYFLVTLYVMGIQLTMYGTSVFLRYKYNLFGDIITGVILIVVTLFARGLEAVCIRIGDRLGIWVQKRLDSTLDDELAARLALGPGRQKDLERERLELQALNSERFRHRFMERNRPWLLQHLVELFTPRTLAAAGTDGRPNAEYVRDIYHELMNMGEGGRLHGDRSDISSDSEDELEKMRRNWSNVPVDGASKDIALFWLARARKRRVFTKLVGGIIGNNKQPTCFACQKSEDGGYTMHVDLSNAEQTWQDPTAIDRLIYGFEGEFGELEMDADLWKAYFRKHATYVTLCNVCLSALQQKRLARLVKQPPVSGQRKLRDDEFSSDDDDDVAFEPVVIGRSSVEGRVLSKWLLAARTKLGGVFPREHARHDMELYAKKMRAKKARKGKQVHVDSDEEDPSVHWRLQLNEASRAIALRWIWQARDTRYTVLCAHAADLRSSLSAMCEKMLEVDDWFYGKELRLDGARLIDEGNELHAEQTHHDEEMAVKMNQTQRDFDAFEHDKRESMRTETDAFQQILDREREDATKRAETRELELLELHRQKEIEFAALQKQARDDGALSTVLVNEHRAYLAKMEDDRVAEIQKLVMTAADKEKQKRDAFERKLALSESAIQNRKALAQHRMLSIRKEAMNVVRQREKSWQARASGWMEKAGRKISVREQEELEAKANEKKRRKRVVLAQ